MLVARSFVLAGGSRAALAVLLVACSVAYALVSGSAAGGLRSAGEALSADLVAPAALRHADGLAPFDASLLPGGSVVMSHAQDGDITWGTVRPWPYGLEVVPGPYVRASPAALALAGLPVGPTRAHEHAPWNWALLPPERFDLRFPELMGQATLAVLPPGAGGPQQPAPAAGAFYEGGAAQVGASLHLVVVAMGLSMAVFSAGLLRLEVLARERDLATLEALGGLVAARRAVVLRSLVLVGAGVGLGLVLGMGLVGLAGRTQGGASVGWPFVAEVAVVALVAGAAAGIAGGLAHLRPPLALRLGRRGPAVRRFPGPVRFLLVTPRLFPAALASALVLASVCAVVLAATAIPWTMFQPQDGTVVVGQAADNPFRGSADRFIGEHATLLPGVSAASPEILVPTVWRDRPVMVRGVQFEGWRELEGADLLGGRWPEEPGEATVGARAARGLGLGPGEVAVVPAAYRASARALTIVGVHGAAGLADDEVLTDLDTAADLAALPPDQVHLTRLRVPASALGDALEAVATPMVTDLRVVPPDPVPLTSAMAVVRLVNLSPEPQSRALLLRVDNETVASTVARVPARGEVEARLPFSVPPRAQFTLRVNPELSVSTRQAELLLEAPDSVPVGTPFEVVIRHLDGRPAVGALVEGAPTSGRADDAGRVTLQAGEATVLELRARLDGLEAGRLVFVVDPAWALSAHVRAIAVDRIASGASGQEARHELLLTLANLGGAAFDGQVEASLNGTTLASFPVRLGARQRTVVPLALTVPAGGAEVDIQGRLVTLPSVELGATPGPPPPGPPAPSPAPSPPLVRTVEDVLAEKRRALEAARRAQPLSPRAFIEDVFEDFEQGVRLVLLATFAQTGAGIVVAVLREGRERSEVARIMAEIGATPEQLSFRAAREAAVAAALPVAAGIVLAAAILAAAAPFGFPAAFGHTLPARLDLSLAAYVGFSLTLLAAAAGAWVGRLPPEEPARQAAPEPLDVLLGGDL